jgi:hypothetical protein
MSRSLRLTPLLLVLVTACDSSDPGNDEDPGASGDDTSADCASADDPAELTISDVTPAPGSTVPNVDVVHRFVIADSPGLFSDLLLAVEPGHTAGTFDSEMPEFTVVPRGDDLEYSLPSLQWDSLGHVQMSIAGVFVDGGGCHYTFPPRIFDYDLREP